MSKKSRDVKTLHADFSVFICRFFFFYHSTLIGNPPYSQIIRWYLITPGMDYSVGAQHQDVKRGNVHLTAFFRSTSSVNIRFIGLSTHKKSGGHGIMAAGNKLDVRNYSETISILLT